MRAEGVPRLIMRPPGGWGVDKGAVLNAGCEETLCFSRSEAERKSTQKRRNNLAEYARKSEKSEPWTRENPLFSRHSCCILNPN